jgi:hypothetical protein
MRWPRIIFIAVLVLIFGAFLHYTLPQRDVVRIVNVESRLTEVGGLNGMFFAQRDSGDAQSTTMRDLRLISTIRPNGQPLVYRNEDTGVLWPPYFKFDSEDLQAEASNLTSNEASPQWVAITHYGWRSNLISIYPNAISIRPVEGPEVSLFPWLNIVILIGLAFLVFMAWRIWERFEDRVIDPIRDRLAVQWAKIKDRAAGRG